MANTFISLGQEFLQAFNKQNINVKNLRGNVSQLKVYADGSTTDGYVPSGKDLPKLNSKYKVYISKKLTSDWNKIKLACLMQNYQGRQQEIGFILTGVENDDGSILIDNLEIENADSFDSNASYRSVSHDPNKLDIIVATAVAKANQNNKKPFVIFGHTHPSQEILGYKNELANSWSFGDFFASYCEAVAYKTITQVAHLLITPSLDTNIMFFDFGAKQFYRFSDGIYEYAADTNKLLVNTCYGDLNAPPKKFDPKKVNFI